MHDYSSKWSEYTYGDPHPCSLQNMNTHQRHCYSFSQVYEVFFMNLTFAEIYDC